MHAMLHFYVMKLSRNQQPSPIDTVKMQLSLWWCDYWMWTGPSTA